MTDDFSTTLAYTKSPKASRRTTFQDELEAAVSARATTKTDRHSYSDDFDDDGDEDDALKHLLNSRKKRLDAFKAGKSKFKINDFMLSDEEGENERPKRVSFMKTQKSSTSPLQDVARDARNNGQTDSSVGDDALAPQRPISPQQDDKECSTPEKNDRDSPLSSTIRLSPTESTLHTASEKFSGDSPLPPPSSGALVETPRASFSDTRQESQESAVGRHKPASPQPLERGVINMSLTDSVPESEPPRPKPRQRSLKTSSPRAEERPEDHVPPHGRPPTAPVPLTQTEAASTTATSSTANVSTASSHSPQGAQEEHSTSSKVITPSCPAASQQGPQEDCSTSPMVTKPSSPARSQQSQALSKATDGSWSRGGHVSEDNKDYDGKYSSSEFQEDSVDRPEPTVSRLSHVSEKSTHTRPPSSTMKGSQRPQSACTYTVESKYLGTLKLLDRKVPQQGSEPGAADDLRSTIYQEWLKKKQEKLQETMRLKREERLKEEKRIMEEQTKKQEAKASFEVWKEKKSDVIKAKVKEAQEAIRKKERDIEEKEEKKASAKKVFEQWKQEHDGLLKEKYRKQKEAENKLKRKTEEKKEERKTDCTSAFSHWDEKKKGVVTEKMKTERRTKKIKEEEERYEKQERDRIALEMYETWLQRKERQQKRQRKEKQIQAILQDDPPPPWSPPNKTVPFGK